MAKAAKTAIKTKDQKAAAEAKNWTKVIKAVRSPKTGAYTFKEAIVHKDKVKDFLARNNIPNSAKGEELHDNSYPLRVMAFLLFNSQLYILLKSNLFVRTSLQHLFYH